MTKLNLIRFANKFSIIKVKKKKKRCFLKANLKNRERHKKYYVMLSDFHFGVYDSIL